MQRRRRKSKRRKSKKEGYMVVLGGRNMFPGEIFPTEKDARLAIAYAIRGADNINTAIRYTRAVVKKVNKEPTVSRKI
ncbi:MAG: hypothetical protein EJNHJLOP_00009 [Methanophagales virus PBV082]|uniref:Uncharacterized protein n=1 Tax=Methanophagales virus PBV082 TaxID=3071307 RepID=A0AA46TEA3_9VIRU|nr:MAG: hypothetical protein QIT52_gp09 [Methanophagales virus PBV082]UYL64898.1 MAG: hypothetical protein EJNHJLOP_00009 [Methanophagales virus PBV082]